jgi:hypothetical protein
MSRTQTPVVSTPDQGLEQLLKLSREALTDLTWPASEGELRRLQDRVTAPRPGLRWTVVAGLATAIAALPVAWVLLRGPTPLTFEVIRGTVAAGGEIRPTDSSTRPADSGTRIHFSDGSEVVLDQEARTQVRDLAADGASIVLTHGRDLPAGMRARPVPTWSRSPARSSTSSGRRRIRRSTSGCARVR